MNRLTAVSLFAGIGGIDLALVRAGVDVRAAVEIDEACRAILARHFPGTALFSDVTEVTGEQLLAAGFVPERGILAGGWPCQDISLAGRRAGMGGARSGLFWQIVRLAAELRPRWLLLENVPGLLSSVCSCAGDSTCMANGRAVRCGAWGKRDGRRIWLPDIQHTPTGGACPGGCMETHGGGMGSVVWALEQLGYGLCWRMLDAQFFGVPQRRARLVFAGCLGDGATSAEVLFDPESGAGNPPPRRTARQDVAGTLGSRAGGSRTTDLDGHGAYVTANALTATYGNSTSGDLGVTGTVVSTLQGGGRRGHRVDAEGAAGGHLVPVAPLPSRDVSHAITSREGKGADSDAVSGFITVQVTHTLTSEGANASEDGTGRSIPIVPTGMPQDHPHAAGVPVEGVRFNWQTGGVGMLGWGDKPTALQASQVTAVAIAENHRGELVETGYPEVREGTAVRRLTPKECERLMGLPDEWTRWRADGTEQSDAARYRQVGNSIAVPVFAWVAHRIVAVSKTARETGAA